MYNRFFYIKMNTSKKYFNVALVRIFMAREYIYYTLTYVRL